LRHPRHLPAVLALAALWLASGVARAAPECVDKKADQEIVLEPPSPADMCLLDASQCAPSDPIPVPVQFTPLSAPQILLPDRPLLVDGRRGSRLPWEQDAIARPGVTRDLLRPPR